MKIVVDKHIPFVQEVLSSFVTVSALEGDKISSSDVADADAMIVRTRTKCNAALLDGSTVRFIATATIGFDHIDMGYCSERGIKVVTAAGCNARGVLQWVGSVLVYLSEKIQRCPAELTLGVVGVGNVGSLVASYARDWGFRVLCSDPPRERNELLGRREGFVPLEEIARSCDIISFHPQLSRTGKDATFHLAGEEFFSALKSDAVIINASRGEVVDNGLLCEAVADGRCSCCMDVWEGEPDINLTLLEKALVATPHIAGYTVQGKANASSIAVNRLAEFFDIPIYNWYPQGVRRTEPILISWEDLYMTVNERCDILSESQMLKKAPFDFESLRNNYRLREEYF